MQERNHKANSINSLQAMSDPYCKANSLKLISRTVCKNNCSQWINKKCQRGFDS